jgi:hypothetical protein
VPGDRAKETGGSEASWIGVWFAGGHTRVHRKLDGLLVLSATDDPHEIESEALRLSPS